MKVRIKKSAEGLVHVFGPGPGRWRGAPDVGAPLATGAAIGELEVLGRLHPLALPKTVGGVVVEVFGAGHARVPVDHATLLLQIDPRAQTGAGAGASEEHAEATTAGLVFVSPMSGRFYHRPSPDKESFVTVGDTIVRGAAIGLLEVMKTFNRIAYSGDDLPERARVVRIVPEDGADVSRGDVLLELEPA